MRIVLLTAIATLALAAPASAGSLTFSAPAQLPHGDPKADGYLSGGEPSLAFDPTADGHVYVTAPQGIPAVAGAVTGATNTKGINYWASDDFGATFPRSGNTGSYLGGGDSDVEVLGDHTVLAADLEAVAAAICHSTDFGKTFGACDTGVTTNQAGPENDREWLTRGTKPGEVYLTYHDFAAGFPIIMRSTDSGTTFTPCGSIIDPAGPAATTYTPTGGTLVSKPVVAPDGTIYVEFTTPSSPAPVGAALNNVWIAVAKGGCSATTVFTDHRIYSDPGADLGKIFQQFSMDAGGRLYVAAAGVTKAGQDTTGIWLFTSGDGGTTWSAPIAVNPPDLKANVFPTVTAGKAGEAFVGWFGTSDSGDPNATKNQWRFYGAATYDGGQTFNLATISPDVLHYGDICTQGIFCGLVPGQPSNRNLADFASAAVDPKDGCVALAIPGDPYNRPDLPNGDDTASSSAYFSRQQDAATCLTSANSGKPAATVGASSSSGGTAVPPSPCLDRVAPASRFARAGRRISRAGVTLGGSVSDRGCRSDGRGTVSAVGVALGRRFGSKCRFVRASGRFGALVRCTQPTFLRAAVRRRIGGARFTLHFAHRLRPGRWIAQIRAIDAAGNAEARVAPRNVLRFTVR